MDVIHKKIALNKARSFYPYQLQGYDDAGQFVDKNDFVETSYNYRLFPCDYIVFNDDDLYQFADNLELPKFVDNTFLCLYKNDLNNKYKDAYIFRYKYMLYIVNFVERLFRNSTIQIVFRRNKTTNFKELTKSDWETILTGDTYSSISLIDNIIKYFYLQRSNCHIVDKLPSISSINKNNCPLYCVVSDDVYNEYIKLFGDINVMYNIYNRINHIIKDGEVKEKLSVPYFDFDFCLIEDYTDNGSFSPIVEEWVPNKKYFLNDIVYYKLPNKQYGSYFKLRADSELKNISEYVNNDVARKLLYLSGIEDYDDTMQTINKKYYDGHFDNRTCITHFDEVDENGSIIYTEENGKIKTTHWVEAYERNYEHYDDPSTVYENSVISFGESKYNDLINTRGLYNDDNNKQYPFVLGLRSNSGETIEFVCELPFRLGTYTNNALERTITITEISFLSSFNDSVDKIVFEYAEEGSDIDETNAYYEILKGIKGISVNEVVDYYMYDTIEVVHKIRPNGDTDDNIGVEYIDFVPFTIRNVQIENDGDEIFNIEYFDIPLVSDESEFRYLSYPVKEYDVNIYKDESLNKKHFVNENVNMDKIDRGNNTALEQHYILSEVNTLEDIENYRNNYFNI